jgi:NADPH-dependent glutamate synthase beta subunit-like oxidoreductase
MSITTIIMGTTEMVIGTTQRFCTDSNLCQGSCTYVNYFGVVSLIILVLPITIMVVPI